MSHTPQMNCRDHARAIMGLGLPLIGANVAQYAITLTDTVMLGWYSVEALAGQVLGGMTFFVFFLLGSGIALAVMPMVAEAEGTGDAARVRRVTRMGLWASVIFALAVLPIFLWSEPILLALGQEPGVARAAHQYLWVAGWGMGPALIVAVLRSYLSALERTRVLLWVTLAAVAVNGVVNYALIFGHWGMPEMGVVGAALASVAVQVVSMVALMVYVARVTPEHALFTRFWRVDGQALGDVVRLGWPIGLTNLAEVGLFAASGVMMGWLGKVPLAAHGIALNISSMTFMVHLGLASAATVRAGRAMGRGDGPGLRRGALVILLMSMALAALASVIFIAMPGVLVGAFLDPGDPERGAVLAIGVGLMAAAALFQMVDAGQIMALGLLRGVQDTRVPMVIGALSYWGVGVPVSYVMGFVLGWGGVGIWIGLAVGLALAAVLLLMRFRGRVAAM